MAKKQRSIILSDEIFAGLKSIVLYQQLKGEKASISSVVEGLIQSYLKEHSTELKNIKAIQISLFDDEITGNGDNAK